MLSDDEEKERVQEAMKYIESKTCVKFIPHMKEDDYIMINKDRNKGCYSMIGYRPKNGGPLPVNLQSPECLRHSGTIQHELLHVLGLLHEQSRPDRDEHVTIYWSNIDESKLMFILFNHSLKTNLLLDKNKIIYKNIDHFKQKL